MITASSVGAMVDVLAVLGADMRSYPEDSRACIVRAVGSSPHAAGGGSKLGALVERPVGKHGKPTNALQRLSDPQVAVVATGKMGARPQLLSETRQFPLVTFCYERTPPRSPPRKTRREPKDRQGCPCRLR
jgi:hypothetical protein